jgi:hypothetical protein
VAEDVDGAVEELRLVPVLDGYHGVASPPELFPPAVETPGLAGEAGVDVAHEISEQFDIRGGQQQMDVVGGYDHEVEEDSWVAFEEAAEDAEDNLVEFLGRTQQQPSLDSACGHLECGVGLFHVAQASTHGERHQSQASCQTATSRRRQSNALKNSGLWNQAGKSCSRLRCTPCPDSGHRVRKPVTAPHSFSYGLYGTLLFAPYCLYGTLLVRLTLVDLEYSVVHRRKGFWNKTPSMTCP